MSEQEELSWGERPLHCCALAGLCFVLFAEHLVIDFVTPPPPQRAQHHFWRFNCKDGRVRSAVRRLLMSVDVHVTFVSAFTIILFYQVQTKLSSQSLTEAGAPYL